jgi:phosphomannomutase
VPATPATPPAGDLPALPDALVAALAPLAARADLSVVRPLVVVLDDAAVAAALTGLLGPAVRLVVAPAPPAAGSRSRALRQAVLGAGADLGLVVEAVATAGPVPVSGLHVLDENGEPVDPSVVAALVALPEVAALRAPGRTPVVAHDVLTSRVLPDLLTAAGARAERVAAGADALSAAASDAGVALALGHDGLLAVRDVPTAPPGTAVAGLLAALHLVAALGGQPHPLSVVAELHQPYVDSGEITVPVTDADAARERVVEAYVEQRGAGDVDADDLDGLTVSHWDRTPSWWFHLRIDRAGASGPALRLRVEAADEDIMEKVRDDVLALARQEDR